MRPAERDLARLDEKSRHRLAIDRTDAKARLPRQAVKGPEAAVCAPRPAPKRAAARDPARSANAGLKPALQQVPISPKFPGNQRRLMRALARQGGPNAMAITMGARAAPMGSARRAAPDTRARARAFRLARRHSLLVKMLRAILPIGAAGLSLFYALTLSVSWQLGPGRLKVGEVQVSADDLTMKNPTYFGLTKDGGRYEVRAKKAILEFAKDAPIKLVDVDGDLLQTNNVTTKLKAKHGLLDNAKAELELYDGIEIDASNGMKARLSRATVYNKESRIVSKHPVDLWLPTGSVKGASMTLRTDTREATFVGNVKAHLVAAEPTSQASPQQSLLGRDGKEPVDVSADQLYVNDNDKMALFMGKVVALQGASTLKTPELHITYEGKAAVEQLTGASPDPAQGSQLSRLVAKNGSVLTMGADRRVSSNRAEFDAKADTALFLGDVIVHQQKNVLHGERLFIDHKTGTSRLEPPAEDGQPAGRIAATFYQDSDGKAGTQVKRKSPTTPPAPPNPQDGVMGSFKLDPTAPMDVEADTLDVYDGE